MSKQGRSASSKVEPTGPRRDRKSRRNVLVLASLLGSLSLTSVLLLALAPEPLIPGPSQSLFALDSADSFAQILETSTPIQSGRWQSIYIHHSRSPRGNALTLGQKTGGMSDHFLIGNGDPCADGEIQIGQRWADQQPAATPGARKSDRCISICLVGDFDDSDPTPLQLLRLEQLVKSIQQHCGIGHKNVLLYDQAKSAVGIGKRFPQERFRQQLQR